MTQNLNNKKIELFVDNSIDNYRKKEGISVEEMIKIYLDNEGFFILGDEDNKMVGYLDVIDLDQIRKIIKGLNEKEIYLKGDTIKDLIEKSLIKFRDTFIDSNEKLIEVVRKLNDSEQIYFPVIKKDTLIGRISRRILLEKIKDLY
ncbi:MAG: CBS domain-containing protein [Nanoarchaeota archaeon]|nr:CBS domain-containing protein [Nanoarchaeota archaeon]